MQWPKAGQRSEEKEGFRGAFGGGRLNLGKIWQMHHFPLFLQNKTPSPMNCSEIGGKNCFILIGLGNLDQFLLESHNAHQKFKSLIRTAANTPVGILAFVR